MAASSSSSAPIVPAAGYTYIRTPYLGQDVQLWRRDSDRMFTLARPVSNPEDNEQLFSDAGDISSVILLPAAGPQPVDNWTLFQLPHADIRSIGTAAATNAITSQNVERVIDLIRSAHNYCNLKGVTMWPMTRASIIFMFLPKTVDIRLLLPRLTVNHRAPPSLDDQLATLRLPDPLPRIPTQISQLSMDSKKYVGSFTGLLCSIYDLFDLFAHCISHI